MLSLKTIAVAALLPLASASGFTTFKQLTEGADNSDQVTYYAPSKSNTLFVNVQRKCWWDGMDVDLPATEKESAVTVKLWARRVWTLELSLASLIAVELHIASHLTILQQV